MPEPLVQLQVGEMNARYKISELQLAETKVLDQVQEASAKLTPICSTDRQDVVPNKGTPTGPDLKAKTEQPGWMVRSFAEVTKHGLSLDKHDWSCDNLSQWRIKVDPTLREPIPLMGSDLAPPTALFQDSERVVRGQLSQLMVSSLVSWPPSFATASMRTLQIRCSTLWGTNTRNFKGQCLEARSKGREFLPIGVEAWLSTPSLQPHTCCGNQGRGYEQKNQSIP